MNCTRCGLPINAIKGTYYRTKRGFHHANCLANQPIVNVADEQNKYIDALILIEDHHRHDHRTRSACEPSEQYIDGYFAGSKACAEIAAKVLG
jgi:hypothetical protein